MSIFAGDITTHTDLVSDDKILTTDVSASACKNVTLTTLNSKIDHGSVAGLSDDDHTQYLLLAGRGGQTVADSITLTAGNDLKIDGASVLNATTLGTGVVNSSLTKVGTIATGVWQGTAVSDTYISSSTTWNAKQDALTNGAQNLTSGEVTQLANIDTTTISTSNWSNLSALDQSTATTASPSFKNLTIDNGGLTDTTVNLNGSTDFAILGTSSDTLDIKDTTANATRLSLNSSGNFNFQAGNITTTGNVSAGEVVSDELSYAGDITVDATNAAANSTVYILNSDATYKANLNVENDLVVGGNLTINGTTTTINSTTLSVDDKNIELGAVDTPSDITADGGGITLKGDTDKTILWDNTNDNWTSSEHLNIVTGKDYKINNTSVLNGTTLGAGVVNSSLTKVGTIVTGVWQGTAIGDSYISSAATWNAKQSALTFGIADTNAVKVTVADVATGEYARFNATGLESRTIGEIKTDLSLAKGDVGLGSVENTALSTWTGSTNITTVGNLTGLTVDTSTLYVDATNNRVGIGTTTPQSNLEVIGTQIKLSGNSAQRAMLGYTTGQGGYVQLDNEAETAIVLITSYGNSFFNGGNVGIGTSSPNAIDFNSNSKVLHLYKNDTDGSLLKIESSNTVGVLSAGSSSLYFYATTATPILFGTNAQERMRISSDGNVGIGTSSPATKLEIAGNIDDNFASLKLANKKSQLSGTPYSVYMDFEFENSVGTSTSRIGVVESSNDAWGEIYFSTKETTGTPTERMRITQGGNVGIGTASPSVQCHVSGTGTVYIRSQSTNSTAAGFQATDINENWFLQADGARSGFAFYDINNAAYRVNFASNGKIFFYSLGTLTGQSDVQYNTSTGELGYVSSSIRYKENIRDEVDSSFIYNVPVKTFDRKDGSKTNEAGFIAEDLASVRPDLVAYNEKGEIETYSNTALVPYLIKEIQKLNNKITELENRL